MRSFQLSKKRIKKSKPVAPTCLFYRNFDEYDYLIYKDDEELGIKATHNTPFVWFMKSGELTMNGRCIPEDVYWYFYDIYGWIEKYADKPAASTSFNIDLEYLNNVSAKILFQIIKMLRWGCSNFRVIWYYSNDDSDMFELGEFMCAISNVEFVFIEKESGFC